MKDAFYLLIELIFNNMFLYSILFLFIFLIHIIIFRKNIYFIFDPLIVNIVAWTASVFVIIVMKINDMFYNDNYFYNFIFTQLAFYIGFLCNKYIKFNKINYMTININKPLVKSIYYIYSIIFLFCQAMFYKEAGIPLFNDISRLELSKISPWFNQLTSATFPVLIFLSLYIIYFYNGKKILKSYCKFILFTICLVQFLGGSKAAFISLLFMLFYFIIFIRVHNITLSNKIKILSKRLFAIISIFILISFSLAYNTDNIKSLMQSVIMRIIGYGDIYPLAYSTNVLTKIDIGNVFIQLFGPFLSIFNKLGITSIDIPNAIGYQLLEILRNEIELNGPNTRFNIFGYLCFGFGGSIIYSFIIGYIVSYVRNRLYKKMNKSVLIYIVYVMFSDIVLGLDTEYSLTLLTFISNIGLYIPIFLLSYIFYHATVNNKIKKELIINYE